MTAGSWLVKLINPEKMLCPEGNGYIITKASVEKIASPNIFISDNQVCRAKLVL
jgi:hypothetical protein